MVQALVALLLAGMSTQAHEVQHALALAPEPPACVALAATHEDSDDEASGLYRSDPVEPGEVVLTFDDGPYRDKTSQVLDMLASHAFSATFFVLGRHIHRGTYALLQRMEREGHSIGSHSYDHDIAMAQHGSDAVAYIRGQHEVTRILIELALLADAPDDFDACYRRVFQREPGRRLPARALSQDWAHYRERLAALSSERGFPRGRYQVRYSRPPGGGPYLGSSQVLRARYDQALAELGMHNVMWHGEAGDVHPMRAREYRFLYDNLSRKAHRGGVLLIHDFIRHDALSDALDSIARDSAVQVIGVEQALANKYGCAPGRRRGPTPASTTT